MNFDQHRPVRPAPELGRTCLFCGSDLDRNRAKEHVFPDWILRRFNAGSVKVEPTWHRASDQTVRDQRSHTLSGLLCGCVCGPCNNRWMSDLEVAAEPPLIALSSRARRPEDLGAAERLVVSRWALKTAATLNRSSNFHRLVTREQAATAATDVLAPGVTIVGHLSSKLRTDAITWRQSTGIAILRTHHVDAPSLPRLMGGAWRIVIGVGQCLLLVTYVEPNSAWRLTFDTQRHAPVWPLSGAWPFHDSIDAPDNEPNTVVFYFTNSLQLADSDDDSAISRIVVEGPAHTGAD